MDKLQSLAARYRTMPNGGAPLTVSDDGAIGNGMVIVAKLEGRRQAERALWAAGFDKRGNHWKLTRTVAECGLDHAACQFSSNIAEQVTAGQGKLNDIGDWEIPCPDCAERVQKVMDQKRGLC